VAEGEVLAAGCVLDYGADDSVGGVCLCWGDVWGCGAD